MHINNINSYISYVSAKPEQQRKGRPGRHHEKREFKPVVLAATAVGTLLPVLLLRNRKEKFLKSILNFDYNLKNIITVGFGSVLGGVAGGLVSDKKKIIADAKTDNPRKTIEKKFQEGIYQMISNIIIPTVLADGGLKALKALGGGNSKILKAVVTIAGVSGGMLAGNAVSKEINTRLFPKNAVERNIHLKDAAVHVDDLPMCLALNKEKFFHLEKLVPVGSMMSGYEAGVRE